MPSFSEQPTKHILLIEDNPADAQLVMFYLEETDIIRCEVSYAQTLGQAFAFLESSQVFDAILCDLTLPDSHGFQTLERLLARYPDSNVIVQTGHSDRTLGLNAIRVGAQDFLVKGSYDPEQLGKTLRYSIERRAVLDRLEETQKLARIGHWEYDLATRVLSGSKELFRLLGMQPETLKLDMHLVHDAAHPFYPFNDLHRLTQESGTAKMEFSIFLKEKNSEIFLFARCHLKQGQKIAYGILQDVTTLRQAEDLRKKHEVNIQAARMKEKFLASVSHEMRTPMNAILGMSNLVLQSGLNEEQRNYIQNIKQSSEILLGIVNDILEVSAMQNGEVLFQPKNINLHELLANLTNMLSYKLLEKNLGFDLSIEQDVHIELFADPLRLNQILVNLLGNAIKFTENGHVGLRVSAIPTTKNNQDQQVVWLEFRVEDTGIGIPADKLEAVFESFTRISHKNKLYEGTGLGLSIAKNLVHQQGGTIWVESVQNQGSCFVFQLPLKKASAQIVVNPSVELDYSYFDEHKKYHILLVEDHKMNQLVARKTLEKRFPNVRITLAENGLQAVELVSNPENDFDLVLMDIQMPVMDGTEATQVIRRQFAHAATLPILAMTAHAHIQHEDIFEKYGMNDFVLKPFEPEQLFQKLKKYLSKT